MRFNPSRCHVLSANKRSHHHQYFYELCGAVLKSVESEKYLGVTLSSDLSWSSHITAICTEANQKLGFIKRNLKGTPRELKCLAHLWGQAWNMPALYGIFISSRTVMHWRESRGGLLAGSQASMIGVQALPLYYTSFTLNRWRNADASVDWLSCIKFWTNMWRCRWISWIWFCVIDLSEDLLLNKDLRYLVVLQLSFRNPLLQELLLELITRLPSPHWLRYHPSEAICLLHHARRRAHSIAEISVRRLAIIIQIQFVDCLPVFFSVINSFEAGPSSLLCLPYPIPRKLCGPCCCGCCVLLKMALNLSPRWLRQ